MRGQVVKVEPESDTELVTFRVPRGTYVVGDTLEAVIAGSQQSFSVLKDGKRVINTTASLEAGTQQFKG